MIRQGEIRYFTYGPSRIRVVVVSSDEFNEQASPLIVPVTRNSVDIPPILIALHDSDPLGGCVDLRHFGSSAGGELGDVVGMVTGHTMDRIRQALSEIIGG